MQSLFRFWQEFRRRNVHRGVISYVVFSWVLLQVISVLGSLITVPSWLGKAVLVTLLIAFPFWVVFSWLYDITPEGIVLTARLKNDVNPKLRASTSKRLNTFITIFLVLAVLLLFMDRFRLTSQTKGDPSIGSVVSSNSIAVLPFNDISAQQNQAYFADGLAEELIGTLSRISGIKVTSRTSAFSFKGKQIDIPSIAKQLGVQYILEGSVRTQDSIIRINVQLIDVAKDSYAWSQSWDKKINDIFQIQNEISNSIARKLQLQITTLQAPKVAETDPEAYKLYLEAKYATNQGDSELDFYKAIGFINQSIAIDNSYAPAWDLLAHIYHGMNNHGYIDFEEGYKKATSAARTSLEIDPSYATVYDILATIAIDYERDYKKAQDLINTGLDLEPQNALIIDRASEVALIFGQAEKALGYNKQLVSLDPLDSNAYYSLGGTYYYTEDYKNAEIAYRKSLELDPTTIITNFTLAVSLLMQNKPEEALQYAQRELNEGFRLHGLALCYHALGDEVQSQQALDTFIKNHEKAYSYQIAITFAYLEEPDLAFEWLDKALFYKDFGLMETQIEPIFNPLKKDERWTIFSGKLGFLNETPIKK